MDYRTECLFLHERRRLGKANRNRWLNKRSSITSVTKFGNPATGDKFTTRLFNRIEQADNLVTVPAADQRSDGKTVMLLIPTMMLLATSASRLINSSARERCT